MSAAPEELPRDLHAFWEERAAIRQFDGGMTREEAEALALEEVRQLMREMGEG